MTSAPAGDDPHGNEDPPRRPLPKRVQVAPGVLFQEIEGEGVLMDTTKETYFSLDAMGTTIWKLLSSDPAVELTLASLLDTYEVRPDVLEKDLQAFVSSLIDAGLVLPQ